MSKPPRMYKRGPTYYHVSRAGKWTKLSANRAEAERLWHRVEAGNAGTFGELIDRYLRLLPDLGKAERTAKEYRRQAEVLRGVFGAMPPKKIEPHHVGSYLDQHAHQVAANREVALLSVICGYGLRWGLLDRNPCLGIKRNKERKRTRYISPAEFITLKRAAGRLAAALDMAYLTAARREDVLRITWDCVTQDGLVVPTRKTKVNLLLGWSAWLASTVDWLREGEPGPTLIRTEKGKPYTLTGWDSAWQRLRERSGVEDVHFHDIRGTALTDVQRTRTVHEAQALAGHSSVTMTEAYVRSRALISAMPVG